MCGLFGIIRSDIITGTGADWLAAAIAAELEIAMSERGTDSWGYVTAGRGYESIARGIGSIVPGNGNRRTPLAPIVLGHTRHSTHGASTIRNAHPFERGDVALMHNGIIYNAPTHCTVDSEILAERASDRAPIDDLEGYGTVQWIEGGEAYICRMSGGDLDLAWVSSVQRQARILIWSSDLVQSEKVIKAIQPDASFRHHPTLPAGRVYRIDQPTLTLRRESYEMNLCHARNRKKWYEYGTGASLGYDWLDAYQKPTTPTVELVPAPITGPWRLGDE